MSNTQRPMPCTPFKISFDKATTQSGIGIVKFAAQTELNLKSSKVAFYDISGVGQSEQFRHTKCN